MSDLLPDLVPLPPAQMELAGLVPARDRRIIVASRSFRHTGIRASEDDQLVAVIYFGLLRHVSRRSLASALGVSRHTIAQVEARLEESRELAPLKERLNRQVMLAASESLDWIDELTRARTITRESAGILRSLWVGVGIGMDKAALAGAGGVQASGPAAESPEDAVARYLRTVGTAAPESQSGGNRSNPSGFEVSGPLDAPADATAGADASGPGRPEAGAPPPAADRPEGAGGVRARPAGGHLTDSLGGTL